MAKIVWSALAKEHLKEIDSYISEGSPFYSVVFIDKLIAAVEIVGRHPKIGRIVPEFERDDIREILYHKYRVVYAIKEDAVLVVAVVHGAMDMTKKREREPWEIS